MASKVISPKKLNDLFIANLKWTTGVNELKKHFTKFGPVVKSSVIFDKDTGLSKGYGFVIYEKQESIQAALVCKDHVIDGRKLVLISQNRFEKS